MTDHEVRSLAHDQLMDAAAILEAWDKALSVDDGKGQRKDDRSFLRERARRYRSTAVELWTTRTA